jgi:hypothetical protein
VYKESESGYVTASDFIDGFDDNFRLVKVAEKTSIYYRRKPTTDRYQ